MIPSQPIEPPAEWPADVGLSAADLGQHGEIAFTGSAEPWSRAYRAADSVQLEWREVRFRVSADNVLVDADDPLRMVDLYWNCLISAVEELRGTPTFHGFMALDRLGRGLAVIGSSGAGKTTTGLALLDAGCRLVCDDLIVLRPDGVPPGRPFVRRLPGGFRGEALDVGGKSRLATEVAERPVRLTRVLALVATDLPPLEPLGTMAKLDLLLRNPYMPFDSNTDGARARLDTLVALSEEIEVAAAAPRSTSPEALAAWLMRDDASV